MTESEFEDFLEFCKQKDYPLYPWQERLLKEVLTTEKPRPVYIQYKTDVRSIQLKTLLVLFEEFKAQTKKDI